MPPQVNPSGCRPIYNQASASAEEVKSCETEKKAPEEPKESSTSTTDQHRATQKEVSNRKAELSTQAVAQQAALNGKLEQKAAKSENGVTPATTIEDAVLRLESVSKETERLLEQHNRARQQRANNTLNELESVSKETERLLEQHNRAQQRRADNALNQLESVSKETERLFEQHSRAQQQRADNALNRLESVSKETERLLELEKAKIRANAKTSHEVRKQ